MKVLKRTPRTDLRYQGFLRKMVPVLARVAEDNGVPQEAADDALESFAWLSARVEFEKGEVDFPLALPSDTPEQIEASFNQYLDTEHMDRVTAARAAIRESDRPTSPASAPAPPEDAESKD